MRPACWSCTVAAAEREIALAAARGALAPETAQLMSDALLALLQGPSEAVPLTSHGHSIAARYAVRPAAGFVRASSRARERRLGLGAHVSSSPAASAGPPCCTAVRMSPRSRSSAPAGDRSPRRVRRVRRGGRPRPLVPMRWARAGRPAPVGARAPRRRRGAAEERDRHLRRRHRRPISRTADPSSWSACRRRERDGRTWTLPKGTPIPARRIEQTAIREVGEETGLEVRITGAAGLPSTTGSSSPAPASTRRSTTS